MKTVQVSRCGGTVTLTCPFTQGFGLNTAYHYDPIVEFQFKQDPSKCVGANAGNHLLYVYVCGATGTYWVQNDNYAYYQYGSQININDTNTRLVHPSGLGNILNMTANGATGGSAYDGAYQGAASNWGAVYK